jgi:hypothetical protein
MLDVESGITKRCASRSRPKYLCQSPWRLRCCAATSGLTCLRPVSCTASLRYRAQHHRDADGHARTADAFAYVRDRASAPRSSWMAWPLCILVAAGTAKVEEHHEPACPRRHIIVVSRFLVVLLRRRVVLPAILPLESGDVVLAGRGAGARHSVCLAPHSRCRALGAARAMASAARSGNFFVRFSVDVMAMAMAAGRKRSMMKLDRRRDIAPPSMELRRAESAASQSDDRILSSPSEKASRRCWWRCRSTPRRGTACPCQCCCGTAPEADSGAAPLRRHYRRARWRCRPWAHPGSSPRRRAHTRTARHAGLEQLHHDVPVAILAPPPA